RGQPEDRGTLAIISFPNWDGRCYPLPVRWRLTVLGRTVALLCWATVAAASSPHQVADLAPGAADANIDSLRATGSNVVFRRAGSALWGSDGSAAGTALLVDLPTTNLTTYDAGVMFSAPGTTFADEDLWKTDGTLVGTTIIRTVTGMGTCPIGGPCNTAP